jgi:hypothetical protein
VRVGFRSAIAGGVDLFVFEADINALLAESGERSAYFAHRHSFDNYLQSLVFGIPQLEA